MLEDEQVDLEFEPQQRGEVSEAVLLVAIGGHALRPQSLQALSPHRLQPAQTWSVNTSSNHAADGCSTSQAVLCVHWVNFGSLCSQQAQCLCRKFCLRRGAVGVLLLVYVCQEGSNPLVLNFAVWGGSMLDSCCCPALLRAMALPKLVLHKMPGS